MAGFACSVLLLMGRFRDKLRWALLGSVCAIGLVSIAVSIRPDLFRVIGHFAYSLKFWEEGAVTSSHSTMVRVYEFRNIHAQLVDHNNLILGEGPGSSFSDRYHPIPFGLTEGDYSTDEIVTRKFQNPHGILQTLMLNLGYGGMALYLLSMFLIYYVDFKVFAKSHNEVLKAVALTLLASLPSLVYGAWSPAARILLGVLFGVIAGLDMLTKAEHETGELDAAPQIPQTSGDVRVAVE